MSQVFYYGDGERQQQKHTRVLNMVENLETAIIYIQQASKDCVTPASQSYIPSIIFLLKALIVAERDE